MAKKIQGEDGKTYVEKKPFYKRVWFWIVIVILIFAIAGSMGNGSSTTSSSSNSSEESNVPTSYTSALHKAKTYSDTMHMSKQGIYDQLTSEYGEKFPADAAQYAIDNIDADWNANALAKAKEYQETLSMSKQAIYDQLISEYGEKFTPEEAQYAIDNLD